MDYDYSSDSTEEFTTYSQDETHARELLKKRREQRDKAEKGKEERKQRYEEAANKKDDIIFNLQGVTIMKYNHTKIKFCYRPSLLYHHISQKLIFYCSLRYLERYKKWLISKEPMPARPLYHKVTSGTVLIQDRDIDDTIRKIYTELNLWSEHEIRYRRRKYEQYRAGDLSYLDIDSTDEELYFSDNERKALFEKRQSVLRRMIPPKSNKLSRPKRKAATTLKYVI